MVKTKNRILLLLTIMFSIALVLGVGLALNNGDFKVADAATQTMDLDDVAFTMDKGAAVRKDTPTGLRFRSLMSVDDYNALEANTARYTRITYGMLIAPTDYLLTYGALNEENVFGANPVYGWKDANGASVGGGVQIINVARSQMTDFTDDNGDDWKCFMGVISNVKGTNYHREFVGVGYIQAVEKSGKTVYKFATANDNSRTVAFVAQKALSAGVEDSGSALKGFVQHAYMNELIYKTQNATSVRPIDYAEGVGSFTASASGMYIYFDKTVLAEYGGYYDYMDVTVHSSNAAEFRIFTVNSSDQENAAYVYNTLTSSQTHRIPLNDKSVHDFSKHDLRLFAAGAGQNITIDSIQFVKTEEVEIEPTPEEENLGKTILSSEGNFWNYFHFGAWGTNDWDGSSVNVTTSNFQIQKAFIDDALEKGYTH
ncbi:MAG: hypothetical protein IJY84_02625, partial [Clostridia bacterium]|nr:hypothetical protein [Clostridia bacterium]